MKFHFFKTNHQLLLSGLLCLNSYAGELAPKTVFPNSAAFSSGQVAPLAKEEMLALQSYQKTAAALLPTALSSISSVMKNPYILLIAGGGTCLAYAMTGASPEPIAQPELMLGLTQEHLFNLGKTALSGLAYGLGAQGKAGIEQTLTSYAKPVLLGGAAAGLALVNTTMSSEDHPYLVSILNSTLLGALPNLLADLPAVGKKIQGLIASQPSTPAIKDVASIIKQKSQRQQWQKKMRALTKFVTSDYVVAFISFGSAIMLQTSQAGTLSESDQALALATLTGATQLIQHAVVGEYAYRATELVTSGLSSAARFSKNVYQSFKSKVSSLLFSK